MSSHQLQYTGSVPVSFSDFAVEPGDIFYVPDHLVPGFVARPDILDLGPYTVDLTGVPVEELVITPVVAPKTAAKKAAQ